MLVKRTSMTSSFSKGIIEDEMRSFRFYPILIFYCSFSLTIFVLILFYRRANDHRNAVQRKVEVEYSTMTFLDYFVTQNKKNILSLNSVQAEVLDRKKFFFDLPKGIFYSESVGPIDYVAKKGALFQDEQLMTFMGEVFFNSSQGEHHSDAAKYYFQRDYWEANGSVHSHFDDLETKDKIDIYSIQMNGRPKGQYFLYQGKVHGTIKRAREYEGVTRFESDTLEASLDKSLITLDSNVYFEKKPFEGRSRKAEIYLDNFNKKLKYYILYDDVRLKQTLENGEIRTAFSEKLEGEVGHGDTVTMTGAPRVIQGKDIVKGYKMVLRQMGELMEIDDSTSSFLLDKKKDKEKDLAK